MQNLPRSPFPHFRWLDWPRNKACPRRRTNGVVHSISRFQQPIDIAKSRQKQEGFFAYNEKALSNRYSKMESKYHTLAGMKIHYRTYGNGPSPLLLIHGAVGSTNDFTYQLDDKLGLSKEEFSVVAFDLPGFGRSELNEELKSDPTRDYFELCASIGAELMKKLGHKTYSLGGWSDGARVASLLAIEHQSRVNALLLWGFVPIMDKQSCEAVARTRDTSCWDSQVRELYSSVYGEQRFADLWRKYVDYIVATLEYPVQFDIRKELCAIKCPVLILHGAKDPIVNFSDHVKPLEMQIYNSDIVQFKGLAHNIHQADPNQFNRVLTTFVTSVRA